MAVLKATPQAVPLTRELEAAFLWCLLHDPDGMAKFADWLDAKAFAHAGRAVEAIASYADEHGGRAPSPVVLVQLLHNTVEAGGATEEVLVAVEALVEQGEALRADGAFDPAGVLEEVAERLRRWHAAALAVDAVPRLVRGDADGLAQVEERLSAVRAIGTGAASDGVPLTDTEAVVALFADAGTTARRSPTGNTELDGLLGGGLGVGELGVVSGGTKGGKSMFLSHAAAAGLLRDRAIVYVTLELSVGQVYLRLFADLFGCDLTQLQDRLEAENAAVREAVRQEMRERLAGFLTEHKGRLYVKWLEPGSSVGAVRQVLDAVERRHGVKPSILCVDYADKLGAKGRHDTSYAAMGEVYSDLRQIAVDWKIPVWTGSQATRGAQHKKVVGAEDTADSMHKARNCDVLVSICRTAEEAQAGTLRLYLALNRNREAGKMLGPYKVGFARGRPIDEDESF